MVWIDCDHHIELLTSALRAADLQLEIAQTVEDQLQGRLVETQAQLDAERAIADRTFGSGVEFSPLERRGLSHRVPTTSDGQLDELALEQLVDEHIWLRRLAQAVQPAAAE